MNLTIHRGTKQIGGCVTEISTEKTRVFIDLGADLTKDKEKSASKVYIDGLTEGNAENSYLLITHYHGDHIGRITQALPKDRIYMGETARKIQMTIKKTLLKLKHISEKERIEHEAELEILKRIKPFKPGIKFSLGGGDIKITPIMIDHSAFDAYSFIIEKNGIKILYTGDFRLHGPRGGIEVFEHYAKNINYMICEGTNVLKPNKAKTEFELRKEARGLFKKYNFILCSSTNIDRIFTFYHAYNDVFKRKRPFICKDFLDYQEEILKIVSENHSEKSHDFYNYVPNKASAENGYCRLIRFNKLGEKILAEHFAKHPDKDESLIIYSMWDGYLDEKNKKTNKEEYIKFLKPYSSICKHLHTSGHADIDSIKKVAKIVKPTFIIPIHTDAPESFKAIFKNAKILRDKQTVELLAEAITLPIKTEKEALAAVNKNWRNLEYVPIKLLTAKVCMEAIKDATSFIEMGNPLEYVPKELKTPELCMEVVKNCFGYGGSPLQYVPEKLKTLELCMEAVKKGKFYANTLEFVPEKLKTPELCMEGVKGTFSFDSQLEYVPEKLRTLELCLEAVKADSEMAMKYVPEKLKDKIKCILENKT